MSCSIGVDIGGTNLVGALVDDAGRVLQHTRRDTPAQDVPRLLEEVAAVVTDLASDAEEAPVAVGLACAAYVDAAGATIYFAPNLAWRDVPLRDIVQEAVGLPVVVENDANAAAWGEYRFGAGRDIDDMLLLTVGTGVGGGIIADDRLLRGAHGVAAEVGHLRVVPGGHRCGCGNRGCLEQYASGNALVREARDLVRSAGPHASALVAACGGDAEALTGPMVTDLARDGDTASLELLEDLGRWLGEGAASLAAVLDPGIVVLGGGVSSAGDLLLDPTRTAFEREITGRGHRPVPDVVIATLGNRAGVIGAATLGRERTLAR